MADYILPRSDAILTVPLEQDGTAYADMTVTATVYSPRGVAVATNVAMTPVTGVTGSYALAISRTWSESNGKAVPGEYVAEVTALRAGVQLVTHIRYVVRFDDDS